MEYLQKFSGSDDLFQVLGVFGGCTHPAVEEDAHHPCKVVADSEEDWRKAMFVRNMWLSAVLNQQLYDLFTFLWLISKCNSTMQRCTTCNMILGYELCKIYPAIVIAITQAGFGESESNDISK